MSLTDVAQAIGWNISTISRLERGLRHVSPEAVMGLAVVYRLPTLRREELVSRAKEPPTLGWWDRPPAGVPAETGALASYEQEATRMTDWNPGMLPGMIQTPEYAKAMMLDRGRTEAEVHPLLGARLKRQQLLNGTAVDYTAILGMAALTNQMCGERDFIAQLRHLIRLSDREGIEIRVVDHPTSYALGAWYLMNYADTGSVVLVEHLESSTFLFDKEAAPYVAARKSLLSIALSVRASRDRIEDVIERIITGS